MGRTGAAVALRRQQEMTERQLLLKEFSPALRQLAAEYQQDITEQVKNNVSFYWHMGNKVIDLEENPDKYLKPEQKAKGVSPLNLFLQFFGASKETITKAIRFRRLYPTKQDLERLFGYRNKERNDFRLNWGHVVYLITVEQVKTRIKFEELAAEEALDCDELHARIMAHYNGSRRPGSGRKLGIPKQVPKQLAQIVDMSRLWVRRHEEVWNGPQHSVFANVMNLAPDQYSTEMLQNLESVEQSLEGVKTAAEAELDVCKRTTAHVRNSLKIQGADEAPPTLASKATVPEKTTKKAAASPPTKPLREIAAGAVKSAKASRPTPVK